HPPRPTLFPYTTLFRSGTRRVYPVRRGTATRGDRPVPRTRRGHLPARRTIGLPGLQPTDGSGADDPASHGTGSPHGADRRSRCRSEEHTSELQSLAYLV